LKALLILAAGIDLGLAALLIGVSGFLFGSGPESMHGGPAIAVAYAGAVIACVLAPVAGFVLNNKNKAAAGLIVGFMPPAGALLALAIPAPY
jgi:hypothetical protein